MTKREFYREYRGEASVSISEIKDIISSEDLWDYIDIKDEYEYDEWIENEADYLLRDYGWREVYDYLNGVETGYCYYLFGQYGYEYGLTDDDIDLLLDKVEEALEDRCDEWLDDGDPDEDDNCEETQFVSIDMLFNS